VQIFHCIVVLYCTALQSVTCNWTIPLSDGNFLLLITHNDQCRLMYGSLMFVDKD